MNDKESVEKSEVENVNLESVRISSVSGISVDISCTDLSADNYSSTNHLLSIDLSEQKEVKEVIGIRFNLTGIKNIINVEQYALLSMLGIIFKENDFKYDKLYSYFIQIKMPCGSTRQYKTIQDFPLESVPCDCGNHNHYFVKYNYL